MGALRPGAGMAALHHLSAPILAKPRYEARHNAAAAGVRPWGIFDTFWQSFVAFEGAEEASRAIVRARELNHAYERTL